MRHSVFSPECPVGWMMMVEFDPTVEGYSCPWVLAAPIQLVTICGLLSELDDLLRYAWVGKLPLSVEINAPHWEGDDDEYPLLD